MKKTHWLRNTLITLAICAVVGVVSALIVFYTAPDRTSASATIEFSFDGAAEGQAPNGYRFDLNGFTQDEVLNAALAEAGLADKYTADQIRENLIVTGVYPEDIVTQMTSYESLLTGDASRVKVSDYHATLYNVTLYNDFDRSIAKADLEKLLVEVMKAFHNYFDKTYSIVLAKDTFLDGISAFDYSQQLLMLQRSAQRFGTFARQMENKRPDFLVNGNSFGDVAVRYEELQSTDLERLSGMITMNALSRNKERIIAQYENEIRVLEIQLKEKKQQKTDTEKMISQYEKDEIIYISTTTAVQQVSGESATETYDAMVARRKEIENYIADINKQLTELKQKLADIKGEAGQAAAAEGAEGETVVPISAQLTPEQEASRIAAVEQQLSAIVVKLNNITNDFASLVTAYSANEMNDRTITVSAVKYDTPKLLSGAFAKTLIKNVGPFCVLGFIGCLIGLIRSRRKEEKLKAKAKA